MIKEFKNARGGLENFCCQVWLPVIHQAGLFAHWIGFVAVMWVSLQYQNQTSSTLASSSILKILALERLAEAEVLFGRGHYSGAYYVGGYAIELALKAVVCKKLNVEMFEKEAVPRHIAKSFMIHDLTDLMTLAGLVRELEVKCQTDAAFQVCWSLVSRWSEQRRYDPGCSSAKATTFVFSLKIVIQWLQKNW